MAAASASGVLSKRYATALFELSADKAEKDAKTLLAASAEKSFRSFLNNPTLSRTEQVSVLSAIVPAGALQALVLRVAKNRRLPALPDILRAYLAMVATTRGEVDVVAESANKLDAKAVEVLGTGLSKALNKSVKLNVEENPALLGGLRLKLGNTMIDYSVETALNRLGNQLKSTSLGA